MPHQVTKQYEIESEINHNKTYVTPPCISLKKTEAAQIRAIFWSNWKNGFITIPLLLVIAIFEACIFRFKCLIIIKNKPFKSFFFDYLMIKSHLYCCLAIIFFLLQFQDHGNIQLFKQGLCLFYFEYHKIAIWVDQFLEISLPTNANSIQ